MTVHSSKGLEYDYVYIVGMEENLFPSQMAIESANIEEERRLFYVAITRAKVAATLSFSQTRFKWGSMEFTRPSQFLREIDPAYLDIAKGVELVSRRASAGGGSARRDDFVDRGSATGQRKAVEELRRRYDQRNQQSAERPREVTPSRPSSTNMRSLGAQQSGGVVAPCSFSVGDRVEHPRFGEGQVVRIEMMATDHKVVVLFDDGGEKTLLSKFAKLEKK